jgi:hypothetical protein
MRIFLSLLFLLTPAFAQTPDPAKLLAPIQQQRNQVMDAWAQCLAASNEMQNQLAELRKELEEAKAKLAKPK